MGRFIHFALAAAQEAMEHSGLKIGPEKRGQHRRTHRLGHRRVHIIEREPQQHAGRRTAQDSPPFFIPAAIVNLAAGHVSIKYGAKGRMRDCDCLTSSAHSIGDAFRTIQRGMPMR